MCVESSPLEMDTPGKSNRSSAYTSYSTFSSSNSNNSNQTTPTSSSTSLPYCFTFLAATLSSQVSKTTASTTGRKWVLLILISGILIIAFISAASSNGSSNNNQEVYIPGEDWYHNHYKYSKKVNGDNAISARNLLIVQLSNQSTKTWSDVASKPNRAYARQWAVDYMIHYANSENDFCQSQLLWDLYQRGNDPASVYDAVLFLSSDAIITDLDFNFLTLLPKRKLLTTTTTPNELSLFNLRHGQFEKMAKLWLDDTTCTTSLLQLIRDEMSNDNAVDEIATSRTGFVEPRLVKFLVEPADNTAQAKLQTTVDSVCYRYYPRCDVLR
jgi:hypothetical protein